MDRLRAQCRLPVFFLAVSTLIIAALHPLPVEALSNTGSSLTTSPVAVDLTGKPGTSITTKLHILNNGPTAIPISVRLEEFKAHGNQGGADIYKPPPGDVPTQWVHFSESSFVAQPQVWQDVTMTIALPRTASLAYYYAVLFYPQPILPNVRSHVNTLKSANAILVLVSALSADTKPKLHVASFSSEHSLYQYLPTTFNVDVHNDGNIFLVPRGDVFITRTKNGPPINTIVVNSGQGNVLPATDRLFQAQWTNGFPVYQYQRLGGQIVSNKNGAPVQHLQWNFNRASYFRFGKYYAKLVLVYSNGVRDISTTSETSFWVIPWFFIACAGAFLVLIIIGIWTIVRLGLRRLHRQKKSFKI